MLNHWLLVTRNQYIPSIKEMTDDNVSPWMLLYLGMIRCREKCSFSSSNGKLWQYTTSSPPQLTLIPLPRSLPHAKQWHTASHATRDSWLWQSLPHHAAVDEGKGRRWDEPPNRQLTAHFSLSVCLLSWLAELWPDWSVLRRITIIEGLNQRSVFLRTSGSFNPLMRIRPQP